MGLLPDLISQIITMYTTETHYKEKVTSTGADVLLGRGEIITISDAIPPSAGGSIISDYDAILKVGDGRTPLADLPIIGGSKYVKMVEELYESGGSGGGASDLFWNTF